MSSEQQEPPSSFLILIIEGNRSDEALTLRALSRLQRVPQTLVVREGAEAVAAIKSLGETETLSLVLVDSYVPRIDAQKILRLLSDPGAISAKRTCRAPDFSCLVGFKSQPIGRLASGPDLPVARPCRSSPRVEIG